MKVFISWSGVRSKALAQALREWLPLVLQYVQPWVSENDITAGDRWAQSVGAELDAANFGVICITPENLSSEWVLFEAGALSKSMQDAKVIPLLFGLELSDISGPLAQFQAKKVDQAGITEIIQAINSTAGNQTSPDIVGQLVPALWPKLEEKLSSIPPRPTAEKHSRSQRDVLEELVASIRSIDARTREVDTDTSEQRKLVPRSRVNPHDLRVMLEELSSLGLDCEDDPVSLLVISGAVREEMPWISEILVETYRDIRRGEVKELDRVAARIQRLMRVAGELPFLGGGWSKESRALLFELPRLIDKALYRARTEIIDKRLPATARATTAKRGEN